ncbi:MAG: GNAT family N-acetyltransferase [Caldilineaceae bacterium]
MSFAIRPYHPADLTALYRICLYTGDSGQDARHLYTDPDLLGHYYAAPYAILEPELAFVLTNNGQVCGYVLGARDTATFGKRCEVEWFPPLRARYPLPTAEDQSRDARMIRAIHRGHDQENDPADYPAHLHIDLLPEAQGQGWGGKLMQTLLDQMRAMNVPAVHLGVGKNNVRAIGFYAHVGFHVVEEGEWGKIYGMRLG